MLHEVTHRIVHGIIDNRELNMFLSDTCKYVIDLKGRVLAEVHWNRRFYHKVERNFDTYDYYTAIQQVDGRTHIQVLKTEGDELIIDIISLHWYSSKKSMCEYFTSENTYLTPIMLREMYSANNYNTTVVI